MKLSEAIRQFDLFARPVTLTYKGKRSYNTVLGGFLSITFVLVFTAFAILSLNTLVRHPVLTGRITTEYVPYFKNDLIYHMKTSGQTIAVELKGFDSDGTTEIDFSVVS